MDLLSTKWLSEMEMNDSALIHQWQHMNSLENVRLEVKPFPSTNISPHDYNHNNNYDHVSRISMKSWKISDAAIGKAAAASNNSSSSSTIISFGNSESPRASRESVALEKKKPSLPSTSSSVVHHQISSLDNIYDPLEYGEMKRGIVRTSEQAKDHVLAERKRREKMTQKFVALSTLIPGLKKLDKATVLGDAINYIKELQERLKELEVKEKQTENAILKKGRFVANYDNDASLCNENNIDGSSCWSGFMFGVSNERLLPEIEVRASEGNLMIRVYCKNQTGVIKEVMGEIEKHNLSIISSSVMPFGDNSLHMTIIAQMDSCCELTPKDLADNIRRATLNLIESSIK